MHNRDFVFQAIHITTKKFMIWNKLFIFVAEKEANTSQIYT